MSDRPIIALVGRPNVGKSTLFNRMIGRREAITSHIAGTTRDRHFGVMEWYGQSWTVVDTAGILFGDEADIDHADLQKAMKEQVDLAIQEATLIAFVTDVKEGLLPADKMILNMIRKANKPVVVLANKVDSTNLRIQSEEFRALGVENLFPVSGIHGSGVRDFVDFLMEAYPFTADPTAPTTPRVTIIGRPNVGKSTLVNQLLGTKRMVVSDLAGTTRDSIASLIALDDTHSIHLVDTAGVRRKGQIEAGIEKFSLFRTLKSINQADLVIILLTIEEAPTRGDAHVTSYAVEAGKKVLIVMNKSDLARENIAKLTPKERVRLAEKFLKRFVFMQRLPSCFVSAQSGEGVKEFKAKLKELIDTNLA